jgi:hypothetical protein
MMPNLSLHSGLCRLCLSHKPLCDSHALPNSLFNYILRRNSGKAIVITDDATSPAHHSSDTWDVELLCEACERRLNRKYDAYGMAVFRGHEGSVRAHSGGVDLLHVDRRRLRMFFLSVLWRISVSSHPNYSNIDLPHLWEEDLRNALNTECSIPDSRYTVALYKMRDSTPVSGFSNEDLRGFIAAPFGRSYGEFISVCFPFLGFFVEIFFPKVPAQYAKRPSIICGRSTVLSVPYIEVLDIPEIMRTLVSALRKEIEAEPSGPLTQTLPRQIHRKNSIPKNLR